MFKFVATTCGSLFLLDEFSIFNVQCSMFKFVGAKAQRLYFFLKQLLNILVFIINNSTYLFKTQCFIAPEIL